MQYLILHKVRGEPAFDIAELIEIGDDEVGWIIPTSGHRAYPYRKWPLTEVFVDHFRSVTNFKDPMPDDWPDHYQISRQEPKQEIDIGSLLSDLMPKGKFLRRA